MLRVLDFSEMSDRMYLLKVKGTAEKWKKGTLRAE